MNVAVIHDWLTVFGGAERALEQILKLFPKADLFSVIDFFPQNQRTHLLDKTAITTFIQKFPFAKKYYRYFLPFMPLAIEQLDMRDYELIISSSHAVAKGVITSPDQLHICYCYSPIRYAWDLYHTYLQGMPGWKRFFASWILHKIRLWDVRTSNGVDAFAGISHFVARRIKKTYRRQAQVIYPPVSIDRFSVKEKKENFYVTACRLVPYKRVDLIVEAFRSMPSKQLYVIGDGPERKRLEKNAPANIVFLGYQPFDKLATYLRDAKAFIYAAIEDFGIVAVEAQACGTPVIAYNRGALLETVRGFESLNPTGCFFKKQSSQAIRAAVENFEKKIDFISPQSCRQNAMRFSEAHFQEEFSSFVKCELNNHGQSL